MSWTFLYSLSALIALMPGTLLALRPLAGEGPAEVEEGPRPIFWLLLGVAICGSGGYGLAQAASGWNPTFAQALWLSIAMTLGLYVLLCVLAREAWRLAPLLFAYLALLGLLAVIWGGSGDAAAASIGSGWLMAHILLSLLAYGFATLSALSAAAVTLQERSLKERRPGRLVRQLPAIADAEGWELRLLAAAGLALLASVASGIAEGLVHGDGAVSWDHKTVFTLLALIIIALLLIMRQVFGLRGRLAARLVLIVYLFLTLAYPGVKFVLDVLIA